MVEGVKLSVCVAVATLTERAVNAVYIRMAVVTAWAYLSQELA